MARYDADQDGRLGFWEFANIFLPVDSSMRREVENRQKLEKLNEEVYQRVRNLIKLIVESEGKVEKLRQNVSIKIKEPLKHIF